MFQNDFIKKELSLLEKELLLRELRTLDTPTDRLVKIRGKEYINFSSNNYLGLANHPEVIKAVEEGSKRWGVGTGASRLISGNMEVHERLEKELAEFKGTEACLLFSSGFAANLGVISCLVEKEDVLLIDRLDHASIIDACNLADAKLLVYPHKDTAELKRVLDKQRSKYRRALVITDSLFSMDGDIAPLPELVSIAYRYQTMLMIDEAHATGVLGPTGRGAAELFRLEKKIDISMGTLSKAFGLQGGFVCGSKKLIHYLINKARAFIYSTGLTPMIVCGALKALEIIKSRPELLEDLWRNTNYLKENLKAKGFDIGATESPIIPVIVNSAEKALEMSKRLFEKGIYVPAIRYPTVAKDQARLRISVMSRHTEEDLKKLLKAL